MSQISMTLQFAQTYKLTTDMEPLRD